MLSSIKRYVSNLFTAIFYAGYSPLPSSDNPTVVVSEVGDTPRYPPFDPGISLVSVLSIIESQQNLIDRLQKTAGLPPQDFNERFLPVIHNLARYVHLLPATRTGHHRGAGGLFRLTLEMSLYSLQIANATIFTSKGAVSAEARYKLHSRWVYAAFIAGACSELYRPVTNMVVTDEGGDRWPQLLSPLYDWLTAKKNHRYHIIWNVQDESDIVAMHQAASAYILNLIVPMNGLQYLNEGNADIVTSMTVCITNTIPHGVRNQIHQIVTTVRKKVIERDLKCNSERYGDFSVGSHLEPHLLDAMRKLIRKKSWGVNVKGARIWHSREGMFIVWQPAAREIIGLLKEDNQPGIPNEADTLADILIMSGIAQSNDEDGRYWDICIPVSMQVLTALKLQRIEVLFNDISELEITDGYLLPRNLNAVPSSMTPHEPQSVAQFAVPFPQATFKQKGESVPATVHEMTEPGVDGSQPIPAQLPMSKEKNLKHDEEAATPVIRPPSASRVSAPPQPANNPENESQKNAPDDCSERLFNSLPPDAADYLRTIVGDHKDGSSAAPIFSTPDGVAISVQELESHGQTNFTGLVKALFDKSWLWTDTEKPMRKLFDLKHEGKTVKAIVIRKDIARSMGFEWKQLKKGSKGD